MTAFRRLGYPLLVAQLILAVGVPASWADPNAYGEPLPPDESALEVIIPDEGQRLLMSYRRGHEMPIINTELEDEPEAVLEPLAFVNSCSPESSLPGTIQIQMSGYIAQKQNGQGQRLSCELMPLSEEWVTQLNSSAEQCIGQAASAIGWDEPESLRIKAIMSYTHKGSRERLSLHAAARAVDIASFELFYPDEGYRSIEVSQASVEASPDPEDPTQERKFLAEFRSCWSEALSEVQGCGHYDGRGSVGWEDSNHQNHLHLSVPYCPSNPHFYGG